jgi:hypothetical protein
LSFARPRQREESNPRDVRNNSTTINAQEFKVTTHNLYLGSVEVSMS